MANAELTAEQNLRLILEIEANRAFILLAYQSNPELLKLADPEIARRDMAGGCVVGAFVGHQAAGTGGDYQVAARGGGLA